ncbi:hypothetical protein SteCoe_11974 [Stentor coeruleus]|uniref:Protein kinase domain-containing protein n=1 Tax=Stentor coeruleus TaxID=5963 RepID=A0A1R2CBU9_9CILI|nr:hypothetical protein SteCoe_11974 [Stentor coeruleus]
MGCCQNSTLCTNEQICLYSQNDSISRQESAFNPTSSYETIGKLNNRISEPPTRLLSSDSLTSLYTITTRISSVFYGERYSCIQTSSNSIKEIIILKKLEMSSKTISKILSSCSNLKNQDHENLVKILFVSEDEKCISLVTEPCSEGNLGQFIKKGLIKKRKAVEILQQILRGIMVYHSYGIILQYLTEREVIIIENQAKISPLVLLNASSFTRAPETDSNVLSDVWSAGLLLLQMLTSSTYIKNPQETLIKLQTSNFDPEDLLLLKRMFEPVNTRCCISDILAHNWIFDDGFDTKFPLFNRKKSGINLHDYCFDKNSEDLSENLSVPNEDESEKNEASEKAEKSSETSNDFYHSRELFDSNKSDNIEMGEGENCVFDYQDIDFSSNGRIKICDMLQDEMKEILESCPDHEESSFEESKKFSNFDENRPSDENPFNRMIYDGTQAVSDKSSNVVTLTESPVFNEDDIKSPDNYTFNTPGLIEEESKEASQELDDNSQLYPKRESLVSLEIIIKDEYLDQKTSVDYKNSPKNHESTYNIFKKLKNEKLSYSDSVETSLQDDEIYTKDLQNEDHELRKSNSLTHINKTTTRKQWKSKDDYRLTELYALDTTKESIIKDNIKGKLKYYSFKKRQGSIVSDLDGEEILLCEGEIVLSGVSLKDLKKAVIRNFPLNLQFSILEYFIKGIRYLKAVDISISNPKSI